MVAASAPIRVPTRAACQLAHRQSLVNHPFSVTFVAGNRLCLGGLGQCVQKCFSLDNKPKENDMSKRGRKRRDRRKHGANHGKRPNA